MNSNTEESKKFFLFQTGQTFGPFSIQQLQEMYYKGELDHYDLFWDMTTPQWKPLSEFVDVYIPKDPLPPDLDFPEPKEEEIELPKKSQKIDIPVPPKLLPKMAPPITAICFDEESTSSGKLIKITKNRCFIQSPKNSKRPPFVIGQPLQISLLSEVTHNSINIDVKFHDVQFNGTYWILELHWLKERPNELLNELKK